MRPRAVEHYLRLAGPEDRAFIAAYLLLVERLARGAGQAGRQA